MTGEVLHKFLSYLKFTYFQGEITELQVIFKIWFLVFWIQVRVYDDYIHLFAYMFTEYLESNLIKFCMECIFSIFMAQ